MLTLGSSIYSEAFILPFCGFREAVLKNQIERDKIVNDNALLDVEVPLAEISTNSRDNKSNFS